VEAASQTVNCNIEASWSIIGAAITNASISSPNDNPGGSVQPPAYCWDPGGKSYQTVTVIEPGKGYWVASMKDCALTML
jgi:hypothetical protein